MLKVGHPWKQDECVYKRTPERQNCWNSLKPLGYCERPLWTMEAATTRNRLGGGFRRMIPSTRWNGSGTGHQAGDTQSAVVYPQTMWPWEWALEISFKSVVMRITKITIPRKPRSTQSRKVLGMEPKVSVLKEAGQDPRRSCRGNINQWSGLRQARMAPDLYWTLNI